MKTLLRIAIALAMVLTMSSGAFAAPNPAAYEAKFVGLKETYNAGESIKLSVETKTAGQITDAKFLLKTIGGNDKDKITSVRTTHSKTKATYTTTGYLKPTSQGIYLLAYQATHKSLEGEKKIELIATLSIKDPNKITLNVTPNTIHVKKGKEVPILITYSSKSTPQFTYSTQVTELYTKRVGNENKKVVLFKAEKAGKFTINVTAKNKYDEVSEAVEIVVSD
ncbi:MULTISPECIES: hypothetical protein [Brevibacillus]|uniref:YtkA-like domain-containing protein n=1 Tax=Brevibacillus brevis TaxID=1393 RepID=A0A2Z4MNN4_BREBE|nr:MULTISPECIES: hypothetical protein [Brevibacillus]AWX57961.1 hypothetical protein AB432_024275 [Brevibacillus brevis]NRR21310.1 hypothetical protein [Brevibacillus sp. MS2.2]